MAKYIVRTGSTRTLNLLSPRGNDRYERGDRVVVRTNRGLEAGEVLCEAGDQGFPGLGDIPQGQLLRRMTAEDEHELTHLQLTAREEFEICRRHVEQLGLAMQLVDIEHLFGGERIVVYYLAEQRVDFRELVKQLAGEFQTRIEMRQIGVRDEAKLLADYGDCGKPVCCNTHLNEMPPVSMKMAKLQKATLDPSKISGRCGRLKCCLRYEHDNYEEMQKTLPPLGAEVLIELGRGRVVAVDILAQQVTVQTEDQRRTTLHVREVLSPADSGKTGKKSPPPTED